MLARWRLRALIVGRITGTTSPSSIPAVAPVTSAAPTARLHHLTPNVKDVIKSGGEWISRLSWRTGLSQQPDVEAAVSFRRTLTSASNQAAKAGRGRRGHRLALVICEQPRGWASSSRAAGCRKAVAFVDEIPLHQRGKYDKSCHPRSRYAEGA